MTEVEETQQEVEVPSWAKPIAASTDGEKILKVVKRLYEEKKSKGFFRGIKFINKAIRKKQKGFVILGADTTPLDIISHLPAFCEDNKVPYIFVEKKKEIGSAIFSKKPIVALFVIEPSEDSKEKGNYDKAFAYVKKNQQSLKKK